MATTNGKFIDKHKPHDVVANVLTSVMDMKFDETLLAKWDQRQGLAPPPYTGAMLRILKGFGVGDPYVDDLPMHMVVCHGGKTKEEIVLQPHPDWVDWDSVERDVLVANGYAQNAETAFERYRETSFAILDWMRYSLREVNSKGQRQIMNVRAMHSFSRRKSKGLLGEEGGMALSQYDMAEVMLGFAGILPVILESDMGLKFTRQQRQDLCHCWRLIGYHLGLQDEYNCCNSLEDMEDMVMEFMSFTPVRWCTARPSTFELQRTAIEGFGKYNRVGARVLYWSGGAVLRAVGNPTVGRFLNWQILFMRDKWADDAAEQRRVMRILAAGAYWMDLVVWRLSGLVALQLQSYIKRFLIGLLVGFVSTSLPGQALVGQVDYLKVFLKSLNSQTDFCPILPQTTLNVDKQAKPVYDCARVWGGGGGHQATRR
ncbi:hypothetical protein BASA81_003196 [Batrachochytrium salamandrivorans]|nr:hypothetical protein BASA81_003196 [Batrachochytrium salamandrivorans]